MFVPSCVRVFFFCFFCCCCHIKTCRDLFPRYCSTMTTLAKVTSRGDACNNKELHRMNREKERRNIIKTGNVIMHIPGDHVVDAKHNPRSQPHAEGGEEGSTERQTERVGAGGGRYVLGVIRSWCC